MKNYGNPNISPCKNIIFKRVLYRKTKIFQDVVSTAWIFPLYFQLPYLLEGTCFQQAGSSAVEGTIETLLGSSDQRKAPASLSLFLKSEKIPALLYVGKRPEYRPFPDVFPRPTGLGHKSQITEGPVSRPFSYFLFSSVFLAMD
jgi:hypothetical protein